MKKKIFKYFACMITVAILATTLLLSWVNYEMFKGRVMDDLEAYGRMFAVEMNGEAEAQSALHSLEEDIRKRYPQFQHRRSKRVLLRRSAEKTAT